MPTIREVADFFIRQADASSGDVMTHLRLQKLAYYAQAWSLAIRGRPIVSNRVEAWPHGPVFPALWTKFKAFGFNPIPVSVAKSNPDALSKDDKDFLGEVWRAYGQFSAKGLEDMTHNESPWIDARRGLQPSAKSDAEITHAAMRAFYSSRLGQK